MTFRNNQTKALLARARFKYVQDKVATMISAARGSQKVVANSIGPTGRATNLSDFALFLSVLVKITAIIGNYR